MSVKMHKPPYLAGHCWVCDALLEDEPKRRQVEQLFQKLNALAPAPESSDACKHLGLAVPPAELLLIGLLNGKVYYRCSDGRGRKPGYVCQCEGCNTLCQGYVES